MKEKEQSASPAGKEDMQRRLGTASVFAICTGAMFSSGFFLLPGLAADLTGPSLPLVYLAGSILILPAIFSIAELCAAIPRAGGPYLFLHRSLGPLAGIIGAVAKYLQLLLKGAFAFVGVGAYLTLVIDVQIQPVAIGLIALFTMLNLVGVKQTARTEVVLVCILLALLAYFVTAGLVEIARSQQDLREQFSPLFGNGLQGMVAAVALIFVSYGGIGQIASLAEEIKKPARSIPRGMLLALGVSALIYFFGTTIMVALMSAEGLHDDKTPVAAAAEHFQHLPLPVLVVVIAALAAFASTGNAAILSAARYPLALARDKLVWKQLGELDKNGVPRSSVILTGVVLVVLVMAFDINSIAKLASAFLLFVLVGMCVAVVIFRESRQKEYAPKYRSPLYPWMQIVGIVAYSALIMESGPISLALLAGAIICCMLWYRSGVKQQREATAAVRDIFARLANQHEHPLVSDTGIALVSDIDLAELTERAIIIDLEDEHSLQQAMEKCAEHLARHIGGNAEELSKVLLREMDHWKSLIRADLAIAPALLADIEQPEMVLLRGAIHHEGTSFEGAVVIVDDEGSSHRLFRLVSQVENVIGATSFKSVWQKAEDPRELKDAMIRNVKKVRSMALRIDDHSATAVLKDKELREMELPKGAVVAYLQRSEGSLVPHAGTILRSGDRLMIVADQDAGEKIQERYVQ